MPLSSPQPTATARSGHSARLCPYPLLVFVCFASVSSLVVAAAATAQETPDSAQSTLGLVPPAGAVVLFDGSNFHAWKPFSWQWINPEDDQQQVQWKLVDGKAMEIAFEFNGKRQKQFLCTKEKFGDYRLHLEF
jgi:hypothetical protein